MNLATRIYLACIDSSLFAMGQVNERRDQDVQRRARNADHDAHRHARKQRMDAEQHVEDMKVIEVRRHTETREALADRRAGQEALRAWQGGSDDRRER